MAAAVAFLVVPAVTIVTIPMQVEEGRTTYVRTKSMYQVITPIMAMWLSTNNIDVAGTPTVGKDKVATL